MIEVSAPKYVRVVNGIQQRIQDGTYPPGSAIPSESALMAEFKVSRPTAVRALGILQQDGWIDSEQGKGRFVRSRSAIESRRPANDMTEAINQDETAVGVEILKVAPVLASDRIAGALGLAKDTPVIMRQRVASNDQGPIELVNFYIPVELASGTGVSEEGPIPEGVLRRLSLRKAVEFDHATERISARHATKDEGKILSVDGKECMLSVLLSIFDRAGKPLLVVDLLMPSSRHEIEDTFPLA